jgi:hypothetical protein
MAAFAAIIHGGSVRRQVILHGIALDLIAFRAASHLASLDRNEG